MIVDFIDGSVSYRYGGLINASPFVELTSSSQVFAEIESMLLLSLLLLLMMLFHGSCQFETNPVELVT